MARTPPVANPAGSAPFPRRRLLALSVLGAAAAAGCSLSDPTIVQPSTSGSTQPTPGGASTPPAARKASPTRTTVPEGFAKAASAELGVADLATAIGKRKKLSKDQRALLVFLAVAHTQHARGLAGPDPAARTTAPRRIQPALISITGLSTKDAWQKLTGAETRLAASHRRASLAAAGRTALLWGSLAVAAESFASAGSAKTPSYVRLRAHKPVTLVSDVQGVQAMVTQLNAIIWGYQLAIGKFPVVSRERTRALAGLLQHRVLRDQLIARLTRRSARVPAAEAAYQPSVNPTDTASGRKLIRQMETALQPFCGLWLAAAGTDADRSLALLTLRSTNRTARAWGAGLRGWPGWSD